MTQNAPNISTTGAFVDDGGGNYYTVCQVGQRKATPEPVYFALLLGSAQEGYFNLIDEEEGAEVTKLFLSDAVQMLDMDNDGIPDQTVDLPGTVSATGVVITEDEASVNIDIDGDGDVDIEIPKP